jgi:hypothetical protein
LLRFYVQSGKGKRFNSAEALKRYLWIDLSNLHQDELTMRRLISLQREKKLGNPREPYPVGQLFQILIQSPPDWFILCVEAQEVKNPSHMTP